jgi:hypothetical protein
MVARPNNIIIRGNPIIQEGIATESITPGDLLEYAAGSAATGGTYLTPYVKKHPTSGGNASRLWALEQDYIGSVPPNSAGAINKTYANLDQVRFGAFQPGQQLFARLAASQNVSYGSYLESNGDGTLKTGATGSAANTPRLVARALEPSNVSVVARIIVEVL